MKHKPAIGILLCILLLAGCGKAQKLQEEDSQAEKSFTYQLQEVRTFAVDEEQGVYAVTESGQTVQKLDAAGQQIAEYDFGDTEINLLACGPGSLFAAVFGQTGYELCEMNLQTGEMYRIPIIGIDAIQSMCITDDAWYLIVLQSPYKEIEQLHDSDDLFFYQGEQALCIDRKTGEQIELPLEYVREMTKTEDAQLVFYGYDGGGGYYFVTWDAEMQSFGERQYTDGFGYLRSFAMWEEAILYPSDTERNLMKAVQWESESEPVRTAFAPDTFLFSSNDLQVRGGDCYVLNRVSRQLVRYDLRQCTRENTPLVCYSPQLYQTVPYSCGYQIQSEVLTDDAFALTVLAGDTDYDICMMHSGLAFSRSIRGQGAFYPLNDVPGVADYLAACHDYIGEAARDENGAIWMLPIVIEVPHFRYRKENCEALGLNVANAADVQEMCEIAQQAYGQAAYRDWYGMTGYGPALLLEQYLSGCEEQGQIDFDTEQFRNLCRYLKSPEAQGEAMRHLVIQKGMVGSEEEYYSRFLFSHERYNAGSNLELMYDSLHAASIPPLVKGLETAAPVSCLYLCVNPNAENLDTALEFISAYCRYLMGRDDTFMWKNREEWRFPESVLTESLYEVCRNGRIYFQYPEEIFWEDVGRYLVGELTEEQLITELNRKMNMYRNE